MNKKLALLFFVIINAQLSGYYRPGLEHNNTYKKIKARKKMYSPKKQSTKKEIDKRYPYQRDSQYASFGSDRTFVDWTHNDMGNR